MKKCPFCAEEIQPEAIKCKHCGEMLNSASVLRVGFPVESQLRSAVDGAAHGDPLEFEVGCTPEHALVGFSSEVALISVGQSAAPIVRIPYAAIQSLTWRPHSANLGGLTFTSPSATMTVPIPVATMATDFQRVLDAINAKRPEPLSITNQAPAPKQDMRAAAVLLVFCLFVGIWIAGEMKSSGVGREMAASVNNAVNEVATGGSSSFSIRVSGSGRFSGAIMIMKDGKAEQRSVEGQAPTSYNETGQMVSVSFQKQEEYGSLGVEILKDGQPAANQNTTAAYGVVTAATR